MATKKKSTIQKLAALLSKRENIKVRSAAQKIRRAYKSEKPLKGLTRRQRQYFAEYKAERIYKEKQRQPAAVEILPSLVNYSYSGTRLMKLFGRVELGSSGSGDIRDRWVNAPMNADDANEILNADSEAEAIRLFQKHAPYLSEVHRFDRIEFMGDRFDDF